MATTNNNRGKPFKRRLNMYAPPGVARNVAPRRTGNNRNAIEHTPCVTLSLGLSCRERYTDKSATKVFNFVLVWLVRWHAAPCLQYPSFPLALRCFAFR